MSIQPSYAYLAPGREFARTVEVSDDVMVDVDAEGHPIGVETLDGSDCYLDEGHSWRQV